MEKNKGILYAIGAYLMWGLFPIYWKQLETIDALQLIAHRMGWSFILLILFVLITRQWKDFRSRRVQRKNNSYLLDRRRADQHQLVHVCMGGQPQLYR